MIRTRANVTNDEEAKGEKEHEARRNRNQNR
jgi:hypothetical protein